MFNSEGTQEIYKALIKAQAEFKAVAFDATNPHFKNKYATLNATQESVRPILAKNELALIQSVYSDENSYYVESRLIHSSGEWIASKIKLLIDRNSMQGLGSATTYAKRYSAQALLGISGDEDDDGNNAEDNKPKYNNSPPPQQKKEFKKITTPEDFVINMGSPDVKGKKLGEIDFHKLEQIGEYLSSEIKKDPQGKSAKYYGLVYGNVKKVMQKKALDNLKPKDDDTDWPPDDSEPPEKNEQDIINRLKDQFPAGEY